MFIQGLRDASLSPFFITRPAPLSGVCPTRASSTIKKVAGECFPSHLFYEIVVFLRFLKTKLLKHRIDRFLIEHSVIGLAFAWYGAQVPVHITLSQALTLLNGDIRIISLLF